MKAGEEGGRGKWDEGEVERKRALGVEHEGAGEEARRESKTGAAVEGE